MIAAIDCADDLNTQHCRDYEIMGYPTIRFFRPYTVNVTNGEEFARGDDEVSALRHTVITKLEATEKVAMPPKWPDLLLVPDKDALWTDQGKQLLLFWNDPAKRVVLLVIENESSFAGSELILDLKDVSSVTVKRVLDSSAGGATDPKVASIQVFAFFRPEEGQQRPSVPKSVAIDADNRQSIFDSVRRYLRTLSINVPDIFSEHYAPKQKQKQQQSEVQLRLVNTVYVDDLNMALHYSLFHEIPLQSNIEGEKMLALRRYIGVLNRFYPFDDVTRQFLLTVARELPNYEHMSGRDFKKLVRNHGNQFENVQRQWVACKGTDSTLRGYPCGLWTLFHTLTVRELKVLQQVGQTTTAPEVLSAMAAYIKNFFGCTDCAEHFTEMAHTIAGNVTTPVDSVLWLWQAHNKVNARLAGDGSEDPGFPKVQFPVGTLCPECRHVDGSWNELKVVNYLERMYGNLQRVDYTNAEPLQSDEGERKVSAGSTGWNLGLVDMRTCIGLYVLCACLLTVYTLRFFIKRNPRSNRSSKYEFTMKA